MTQTILNSLQECSKVLSEFLSNPEQIQLVESSTQAFIDTYNAGGMILSCGNGGSICDAMHFAEELTGKFRKERRALPAMAISDPGHITCTANDYGYENIFSRGVEAFGKKGDCLLAISTSGNSQNVINAVKSAKDREMKVIGLLGKDGGQLKDIVDYPIIIPAEVSDRIQEMHIKLIHIFIEGIERSLFPNN